MEKTLCANSRNPIGKENYESKHQSHKKDFINHQNPPFVMKFKIYGRLLNFSDTKPEKIYYLHYTFVFPSN